MAELLLRGAQTEGELRGRAARMEPIADLAALRPVLASLKAKGLLISLSPEGRGHVVTHALYEPAELERFGSRHEASTPLQKTFIEPQAPAAHAPPPPARTVSELPGVAADSQALRHSVDELRHELEEVRAEMARLRQDLEELRTALG